MSKTLQQRWREICDDYVDYFCRGHEYTYDPSAWVGGNVGGVICINDMFISFDDIRYDVDNHIALDKFEQWYWKAVDLHELGVKNWLNYPSFCKGAPDTWTDEKIEKIRDGRKKIQELEDNLRELIEEHTGKEPEF